MFPSLFALAKLEEAWVVEVLDSSSEEEGCILCFSKPFNDREMNLVGRVLETI